MSDSTLNTISDRVASSASSPPAPPQRAVPQHVRCVSCRYPLWGLRPTANCPECGRPVEATTLQPLLRRVAELQKDDSAWLRSGRRLLFTFIALAMMVGLIVIIFFALAT